MMNNIAKALSAIFSPLLVPTYGVAIAIYTTILYYADIHVQLHVIATTFIMTCVIPLITLIILMRLKIVSNLDVTNRRQRTIPFIVSFLSYMGCAFYLFSVNAPDWLTMFLIGGANAIAVITAINFRWKVSGHSASIGGLVALMIHILARHLNLFDFQEYTIIAILIAGLVGTSRLILGRHTLGQVAAGFAIGFTSVFLATDINY